MTGRVLASLKLVEPLTSATRFAAPRLPVRQAIKPIPVSHPKAHVQVRLYAQKPRPSRPQGQRSSRSGPNRPHEDSSAQSTRDEYVLFKNRPARFGRAPKVLFLRQYAAPGLLVILAVGYYGWETVPITGRKRWNLISSEFVERLSAGEEEQVLKAYRGHILPRDHPLSQSVEKVLRNLIPVSGMENERWEVRVIDDPNTPNAFVMPGGKVFVYTGILPVCKDEQGLAAVLAHEIAHNVANHQGETISRNAVIALAAFAASLMYDFTLSSTNFVFHYLLRLPSSRRQEAEADHIGLMIAAKACYDPDATRQFWERMQKSDPNELPKYIGTHPPHTDRIDNIKALLPQAYEIQRAGDCQTMLDYVDPFKAAASRR